MTGAWWHDFFDDTFASLVLDRWDEDDTARTLAFVEKVLRVAPGATLLDQGAGTGRLAIPLARRGFRVIGVDAAETYVAIARRRAGDLGASCEIVVADAARFVPRAPCDGAFNWSTSFGFDDDEATSRAMIARAHDALVSGGRFALDYANVARVIRELRPEMTRRVATVGGDAIITRVSRLDLRRGTLEQEWSYVLPDGTKTTREGRTRLWMPRELVEAFDRAGFVGIELHGDTTGAPFSLASERCIVVGTKP
jgi:SAM-dependent methyltransferase